jgi:hypothetical protein
MIHHHGSSVSNYIPPNVSFWDDWKPTFSIEVASKCKNQIVNAA